MDRVLLIENSGLTFRCDSVPSAIKESTDKTGMMILKGVPATILDKENGNGRCYTKREIQRSIRRARDAGLFEQKRLLYCKRSSGRILPCSNQFFSRCY